MAAFEPMMLDQHISAFNIAGLAEAFVEGAHVVRERIRRPEADQTDYGNACCWAGAGSGHGSPQLPR